MEKSKKKKEQEIVYDEENISGIDVEKKIKKIKEQLKKCNEEKQEYLAGWQREKADFINYRRRQEEKMREWQRAAHEKLIIDILPILDSLEARLRGLARNYAEQDVELRGINIIKEQLSGVLKNYGLEEIKAVGEKFDPEFHEAVEQVESDKEEGTIIEEIQKGYFLDGKVIRVARVRVTK